MRVFGLKLVGDLGERCSGRAWSEGTLGVCEMVKSVVLSAREDFGRQLGCRMGRRR